MNAWQLGMTILSTIIVGFGVYGWLEERRFHRDHQACQCAFCRSYRWPPETDGVDLTDRDWDLAAKLEVFENDQ